MRRFAAACLAALLALPAAAEWPTTEFLPVPAVPDLDGIEDLLEDGLSPYATGGDVSFFGEVATVETLNLAMMQGIAAPILSHVLGLVSLSAQLMSDTGYDAPVIQPLITVTSTGKLYYPMFWLPFPNAPARHGGCDIQYEPRVSLQINDNQLSYRALLANWNAGATDRDYFSAQLFRLILHETMHGVQKTTWVDDPCDQLPAPKWLRESTADGVSYYFLQRIQPDVMDKFEFPRNARRYDRPLDEGTDGKGRDDLSYGTGSFFRYLMEATEAGNPGNHGLSIVRDVLDIPTDRMGDAGTLIDAIDEVVTQYAGANREGGARTLYNVLPEFYTEYGSYGGSRYKRYFFGVGPSNSGPMSPTIWLERKFNNCVKFDITPMHQVRKRVRIQRLAAECIHVKWSNFTAPVSLQMFADNLGPRHGDLTMGQAVRIDGGARTHCWDVTSQITERLAVTSDFKCILKRGTPRIDVPATGSANVALWTSGEDINGSGEAYFILTNVSETVSQTSDIEFELLVGALGLEMELNPIIARAPDAVPVEKGLTNIESRIHTFTGNENQLLFDAREIDGPGPGFSLASGMTPGAPRAQEGVLTIVRGSNYWVGFMGAISAPTDAKSGAVIVKNPGGFENSLATPNGFGMPGMGGQLSEVAVSGGPLGYTPGLNECGYDLSPTIRIEERSADAFVFHIEGELFGMGNMMAAALAGSPCAAMAEMMEGRASFTVSLPYGGIYDPDVTITIENPPGQASHRANFQKGPSFGGIEASRTLLEASRAPRNGSGGDGAENGAGGDGPGSDGAVESSSVSGGGSEADNLSCACACPTIAVPATPACQSQCRPAWAGCNATALAADPLGAFRRAMANENLPSAAAEALVEDFQRMSPETQRRILEASRN